MQVAGLDEFYIRWLNPNSGEQIRVHDWKLYARLKLPDMI